MCDVTYNVVVKIKLLVDAKMATRGSILAKMLLIHFFMFCFLWWEIFKDSVKSLRLHYSTLCFDFDWDFVLSQLPHMSALEAACLHNTKWIMSEGGRSFKDPHVILEWTLCFPSLRDQKCVTSHSSDSAIWWPLLFSVSAIWWRLPNTNHPQQNPHRKTIKVTIRSIVAADVLSASSQLNCAQTITAFLLQETITLNLTNLHKNTSTRPVFEWLCWSCLYAQCKYSLFCIHQPHSHIHSWTPLYINHITSACTWTLHICHQTISQKGQCLQTQ